MLTETVYAIGTQYERRVSSKRTDLCTVVDVLRTFNSAGELVRLRYVASHKFMGQDVLDNDVVAVTIARGWKAAE